MKRFIRTSLVFTLSTTMLMSSVSPAAFAQPAPNPAAPKAAAPKAGAKIDPKAKPKTVAERLPPEARKHWESALLLYEDQNWEGALSEFRTAYDISKEPRVLRNVAVCEKNLKRYADAIFTLQRSLSEGATDFEPELATQIKDEIDILMPLTSMVIIEVNEPGAEVSIDGRVVGTSPLSAPVRVNVGERTFSAKKAGYLDANVKVMTSGGGTVPVKIALEPAVKMGKVFVNVGGLAAGVQAKVTIDGVEVGTSPYQGDLQAGKHTFEVHAPGYVSQKVTKDIEYKGTVSVDVSLQKEKHEGLLAIDTGVPEATIVVDGKVVGQGSYTGVVASGGHSVKVDADGYKPYQSEVTVLDNQKRGVSIQLERNSKTWLWLLGGGVLVAGAAVGGYFLFKPKDEQPIPGTIAPGFVTVPLWR